jgi:uncharacterized membrane protein YgcG
VTPAGRGIALAVFCAVLAGCATPTAPVIITPEEEYAPELVQVPTPLVEYPPIEPVEPPMVPLPAADPPAAAPAASTSAPGPDTVAIAPSSIVAVPPVTVREPRIEDAELVALLADLQRYGGLGPDDAKRELASVTALLARQRTDANRVRLAVLFTVVRTSPQDDQRALQLLDNVAKSNPGSPAVKQLAVVLQAQISGRQRAVRDEQLKADAALQKLEALRQMERSLLRDRVRSGGGGGGGSGGGGSGGSGSGSGGGG